MRRVTLLATLTACGRIGFDPVEDGIFSSTRPPVIVAFDVFNTTDQSAAYALGDRVTITWTATDIEGLADRPIKLYFSTSDDPYRPSWQPIVTDVAGPSG